MQKLTDEQIKDLRRKSHNGTSAPTLARQYGISLTHTYNIIHEVSRVKTKHNNHCPGCTCFNSQANDSDESLV